MMSQSTRPFKMGLAASAFATVCVTTTSAAHISCSRSYGKECAARVTAGGQSDQGRRLSVPPYNSVDGLFCTSRGSPRLRHLILANNKAG